MMPTYQSIILATFIWKHATINEIFKKIPFSKVLVSHATKSVIQSRGAMGVLILYACQFEMYINQRSMTQRWWTLLYTNITIRWPYDAKYCMLKTELSWNMQWAIWHKWVSVVWDNHPPGVITIMYIIRTRLEYSGSLKIPWNQGANLLCFLPPVWYNLWQGLRLSTPWGLVWQLMVLFKVDFVANGWWIYYTLVHHLYVIDLCQHSMFIIM